MCPEKGRPLGTAALSEQSCGPGYGGESPGIGGSPARDTHRLWDCLGELLRFLKMRGMLEQPARVG